MILLIGPSASGKTEVAKALMQRHGVKKAVTHTSRPMRVGEVQDRDYHFVSDDEFLRLESEGAFVETTLYSGYHYGCSKAEIAEDKCVIVDPNGLAAFLALNDPQIIAFYLNCPKRIREERMRSRGDEEASIAKRLSNDDKDFAPERLKGVSFIINSDEKSPEELAELVLGLYQKRLKEI